MTPETNSYTILIRDGVLARLKALDAFKTVARFGRSKARVLQSEHIPYLGMYLVSEEILADGVANSGEPSFVHTVRYGFSYVIQNNDPDECEDFLDAGYWAVMNGWLTQQDWHRFSDDVRIESILRGSRKHVYGNAGLNNETPIGELQLELTMNYRTFFEPVIPDMLEKVHTTLVYPFPDEGDQRQHVIAEWDIPTE